MIPVTRPYLPSRAKLDCYIDGIYERNWLTNNGPLVQELTRRLESYLGVRNLLLVANGTLALQIAYRALGLGGRLGRPVNAITTPFSFVATSSSLKWEGIDPVFADIDPQTWCLDPENIEPSITDRTAAIVPVHVFGNACQVEAVDAVAQRHGLKVIYDGAHAFGVAYKGQSLLSHGDATTLSFHATKLFHSVEGGAIIFRHESDLERARKMSNFGLVSPEHIDGPGINAKMNEFQAAMGLAVLDEIEIQVSERARVWRAYEDGLKEHYQLQQRNKDTSNNHAYFPILFESSNQRAAVADLLYKNGVQARRYFYPSLNDVDYMRSDSRCRYSEDVAERILCLPLFHGLDPDPILRMLGGKR